MKSIIDVKLLSDIILLATKFNVSLAEQNAMPQVQKTYDSLNIRDQIAINFYNTSARGRDYSINDSRKACD